MQRKLKQSGHPARLALAGMLAALLLAFGLLAASGHAHQSLHHGGDASSASCVVCLFAHGQVDLAGFSPALVTVAVLLFGGLAACKVVMPCRFDFLLPPGRGPPALSYNS